MRSMPLGPAKRKADKREVNGKNGEKHVQKRRHDRATESEINTYQPLFRALYERISRQRKIGEETALTA